MNPKRNKHFLGAIALLSFLATVVGYKIEDPGLTVVSGCIFFVTIVIALSRFIDDCERNITNNDDF